MKIKIFYGPKGEFNKKIPENHTSLNEFTAIYDKYNREGINDAIDIKNLVAYSESYAGITESAILNFNNIIHNFDIDNVYLQNPPKSIRKLLEESQNNEIKIENHHYKHLNKEHFLKINNEFDNHIFGQEKVKKELLISLYSLIKKYNENKPIVILFYGNSGVGKTETAIFLSNILEEKIFRKQFSMFQNDKFVEYLFGGSHNQPSFAKELLERESNIILLDEFDKAANLFHEAFYQLFDEGTFDDKNYSVQLDNSIIICTSNYQNKEDIRKNIGDPLYYRFDKIIKFDNLDTASIIKIMDKNIEKIYKNLDKEDKLLINKEEIKKFFFKYASEFKNSREIKNIIKEKINSELIKKYIKNNENITD